MLWGPSQVSDWGSQQSSWPTVKNALFFNVSGPSLIERKLLISLIPFMFRLFSVDANAMYRSSPTLRHSGAERGLTIQHGCFRFCLLLDEPHGPAQSQRHLPRWCGDDLCSQRSSMDPRLSDGLHGCR